MRPSRLNPISTSTGSHKKTRLACSAPRSHTFYDSGGPCVVVLVIDAGNLILVLQSCCLQELLCSALEENSHALGHVAQFMQIQPNLCKAQQEDAYTSSVAKARKVIEPCAQTKSDVAARASLSSPRQQIAQRWQTCSLCSSTCS